MSIAFAIELYIIAVVGSSWNETSSQPLFTRNCQAGVFGVHCSIE